MTNDNLPLYSKWIKRLIKPVYKIFDWFYTSNYNPLYRSGTLAVAFLLILIVTGFYLLFFYSVSEPYESIERLQQQNFGRLVRTVHRYATAGMIIAVFFHTLQIIIQGKTWGPRVLAWVSGVFLLGMLFLSAWTGYVMVWDSHAQLLSIAGAEMLKTIPILHDTLAIAFNGTTQITSSFFFMNLFLHIAIPLGMIFTLWVHTAKLSRNAWLPQKKVAYYVILGFCLLSILWPASLEPKADLFNIIGKLKIDWFYGFWLSFWKESSAISALMFWLASFIFLLSFPLWWKPRKNKKLPISKVNPDECTGCNQCMRDCPFDAIKMVPHPAGKKMLAEVINNNCVSCGICAASCLDLAIGPPMRDGHVLIDEAKNFLDKLDDPKIILIACSKNDQLPHYLEQYANQDSDLAYFSVRCLGTLHTTVLEMFLSRAEGVIIVGCPINYCQNRGGAQLLSERLYDKRVPFLDKSIERKRVLLLMSTDTEINEVTENIQHFKWRLKNNNQTIVKSKHASFQQICKTTVATSCLLFVVACFSQFSYSREVSPSMLRFSVRVPSIIQTNCRTPSEDEQSSDLVHMRKLRICDAQRVEYNLQIKIDGQLLLAKMYKIDKSIQDARYLLINEQLELKAGQKHVGIVLNTNLDSSSSDLYHPLEKIMDFADGRIALITLDAEDRHKIIHVQ